VFPLEKAMDGLVLSSDPRNGSIKVQIVDATDLWHLYADATDKP